MDTFEEAELHYDNGDLKLAVKAAETSLAAARASQQPALALRVLVLSKLGLGESAEANRLVNEALDASRGAGAANKAAAQVAAVEFRLAEGHVQDAVDMARELRSLTSDLSSAPRQLQAMTMAVQVKVQLTRGALDEAMRAAMEMLASAQKRGGDKGAEAAAWLAIAEVHAQRETMQSGAGTSSTPEETLQAAERSAEIYRDAASRAPADELEKGLASALTMIGRARLRLGRQRQAASAAAEAVGIFRKLGRTLGLTGALDLELEVRRALMEPMIGLQAANRELKELRDRKGTLADSRGATLAEAEILDAIARTHAALSEPLGAVRSALLSAELRHDIGDSTGETTSLLMAAEQQQSLGEMIEATDTAEKALALSRMTGNAKHEEMALRVVSKLLASRGLNEQAPQRPQALQALEALVAAVKDRDLSAAKAAEELINSHGKLVNDKDIADALVPVITRDPGAVDFLKDMGWDVERPFSQLQVGKEIRHLDFYLGHRFGGMGFGPQFKVCNMPVRVWGSAPVAVSVNQLPETEAWQMEMMFRPGFIDAGLQSGFVHAPIFDD